jgi:multisubunit Na+/H+ antiporter MnhC subunit
VSGKKALILTAVVVAAVVLVMYVIAVAASKGLYSVSNKTARLN